MTDFIFMVRESSHMFITGPDVVKTVTGEEVTLEELGGAMSHASKSGVATFVAADEKSCLDDVRYLLAYLPQNNMEEPPRVETDDDPERLCPELRDLLPDSPNLPYDMHKVIQSVLDDGDFMEYFPHWARSIVCGFGRVDGRTVGIVGNQPMVLAGVLDIESSEKAARFVRTCDAFNIPLVTFVDVPGFLPGVDQEYGGIIRHGAKLLYAYCEATVPRIQVITRKAYGGAYVVMNSKSIGADLAFAWPSAELAVMGPQGAVEIVYRRELQQAADPAARARRAGVGVHRALRQPVRRRRAGLRRRRDRPGGDPPEDRRRPRHVAHQARGTAPPQARQHAALMGGGSAPPPCLAAAGADDARPDHPTSALRHERSGARVPALCAWLRGSSRRPRACSWPCSLVSMLRHRRRCARRAGWWAKRSARISACLSRLHVTGLDVQVHENHPGRHA